MRIGVTGHMNLTPAVARLVSDALRAHLALLTGELVGVSCIARGADSLFADAVLAVGGSLEVVLPSRDYRQAKVKPDHAEQFDRLMEAAKTVRIMDFDHANRQAYEAANEAVLSTVDQLVAVWDGQPGTGTGGTAEAVNEAQHRHRCPPIRHDSASPLLESLPRQHRPARPRARGLPPGPALALATCLDQRLPPTHRPSPAPRGLTISKAQITALLDNPARLPAPLRRTPLPPDRPQDKP